MIVKISQVAIEKEEEVVAELGAEEAEAEALDPDVCHRCPLVEPMIAFGWQGRAWTGVPPSLPFLFAEAFP